MKAHLHHGLKASQIALLVRKPDGKSLYSYQAIRDAVCKLEEEPDWRGEREEGSGRPRKTSAKLDKRIVEHVIQNRGKKKVTANSVKKRFMKSLQGCSPSLVERRMGEAGYGSLPRTDCKIRYRS